MRRSIPMMFLIAAAASGAAEADSAVDSATQMEAVYTGEIVSNQRGGLRRGAQYLDNVDVTLAVDGERLWGVPGLSLFAYGLHNRGSDFSGKYSGDSFTISNIDTVGATRLYEAWVDWRFGADANHSVRAGLYDLNSEFDSSETRGLFINSVFGVGHDLAQSGANGPSIFPVTSLGARLDLELTTQWRVLGAVLDGVPGNADDPTTTTIRLDSDEGLLLVTELQRLSDGRVEKFAVGVWNYTEQVERLVGEDAESVGAANNRGWYVSADSRLGALDADENPWHTSVRLGRADERVNAFDWFIASALTYDLPMREGREQSLGLGAAWSRTSSAFRDAVDADSIDDYEAVVELTWRVTVTDWLTLQPDLQYSVNPSADRALQNAVAAGLRFELAGSALPW